MNVKHLDHLNLLVKSFDDTAHWYRRVFGFEVVEQGLYAGEPWGVIKAGDAMLCIYQSPGSKRLSSEESMRQRHLRMDHFALRIKERADWEQTIARESIAVDYGGAYRWPHSLSWYIHDCNGYRIEVVLWDDDHPRFY